jgi:hypothetical protein
MDEEQTQIAFTGDGGQKAKDGTRTLQAGLTTGGGGSQGVNHDEGRL